MLALLRRNFMALPPCRRATMLAAIGLISQTALALSGFPAWPALDRVTGDRREWQAHPFGRAPAGTGFPLADLLRRRAAVDLDTIMGRLARDVAGLPYLSLVPRGEPEPMHYLMRRTGTVSRTYEPRYAGIAFCGMTVRAHVLNDGGLAVMGALPELGPDTPLPDRDDWPVREEALARLVDALTSRGDRADAPRLTHAERCWQPQNGGLRPAWRLRFTAGDLPYSGTADALQAFRVEERYFSITGSAQVYQQNSADDVLKTAELLDLKGDGTLTGTMWRVTVPDGYEAATSADHVFDYDPTDIRFVQPNVYYHVQLQQAYMATLGYEWPTGRTLQVRPHMNSDPNVGYNNAFFQPSDEATGDLGQIKLGDGDGSELKELGIDADVVAHEFGHQVVYTTLKTAARCFETLALHEGLADFFAFARTRDPCLGETICPSGTGACVAKACLRTADLDLAFGDEWWLAWSGQDSCYTHRNGQLFSALLWDLRAPDKIPHEDLARIVVKAVSYFKEDSGFRDFLLSLFMADAELFQGSYRGLIKAGIETRGLGSLVADVAADQGSIPALSGGGAKKNGGGSLPSDTSSGQKQAGAPKKDSAKKKTACGVAGAASEEEALATLATLVLPALLLGIRRRRAHPADA